MKYKDCDIGSNYQDNLTINLMANCNMIIIMEALNGDTKSMFYGLDLDLQNKYEIQNYNIWKDTI